MITPYPEMLKANYHYGYGWFIDESSSYTCLWHSGGLNGVLAVLQFYPELDGSLVVLSNLFNPVAMQSVI